MIQPNLGQKVSELRKAKGLTQEELVELCNISVRTLQRIEHGDVMPRSYTVKSIFSALEYELEDYQDKTPEPRKMKLYGTKKTLIALLGVSLILGATFLFINLKKNRDFAMVKQTIEQINKDFITYYNNGEVDSLMSQFSDQYRIINENNIDMGKESLQKDLILMTSLGAKILILETDSLFYREGILTEISLQSVALSNGAISTQKVLIEWELSNGKWLRKRIKPAI